MSPLAPRGRTPRDELADATAHGEVYLRRLRRAQLQLALLSLVAFGGFIGGLPLALYLAPGLQGTDVLGVPLPVVLLVVPPFPLFLALGALYERRAGALDRAFRDLVRED